jgi:hypothetical protein
MEASSANNLLKQEIVFLERLFETGRADVAVRGEWAAGNAVGGHRTLNKTEKTDRPFVPVSPSTRRAHGHANAYFERNFGVSFGISRYCEFRLL